MSRVQKVILHPTEDRWQKTEGSKNNALRIRLCAKNAGKGLFAPTSRIKMRSWSDRFPEEYLSTYIH
jgi:hypothetical protein